MGTALVVFFISPFPLPGLSLGRPPRSNMLRRIWCDTRSPSYR